MEEITVGSIGTQYLTGDAYCDRLLSRMNVQHSHDIDKDVKDYYVMSDKLGEGAFATVYRGVDKYSGNEVALKVVPLTEKDAEKKVIGSAEALKKREERMKRKLRRKVRILNNEINVLRKVAKLNKKKKKSLVVLYDVIAKADHITVIMELLTGGELFDRVLQLGSYTEADAALIMKRVMRGVKALHKSGIIHRDLKPENLVFKTPAADSQIKITDFGLALIEGRQDIFENIVIGSPGYIAPEVITDKYYSPACDIWSVGCILYILLVGGPPFGAPTNAELFEQIKKGKFGYPSDCQISEQGKDLIERMLTVDPFERIDANGVMKHPWLLKRAAGADLKNTVVKLRNFNAKRKIKEVAIQLVYGNNKSTYASNLRKLLRGTRLEEGFTGEELVQIRDGLFEYCNEKRRISKESFAKLLVDMNYDDLPHDELFEVFSNGREKADVAEVCIGMATYCKSWNGSQALRFCFETYDREGTGEIPKEDVQKILRAIIGDGVFKNISAGLATFFKKFKGKDNNNVSFQDFRQQFLKYGDTSFKKNVVQPVNKLLKRITQIPQLQMVRNKLSMSFTLASVKTSASGLTETETSKRSMDSNRSRNAESEDNEEDNEDSDEDSDDGEALGSGSETTGKEENTEETKEAKPPPNSLNVVSRKKGGKPEQRFSWTIKDQDLENEI